MLGIICRIFNSCDGLMQIPRPAKHLLNKTNQSGSVFLINDFPLRIDGCHVISCPTVNSRHKFSLKVSDRLMSISGCFVYNVVYCHRICLLQMMPLMRPETTVKVEIAMTMLMFVKKLGKSPGNSCL